MRWIVSTVKTNFWSQHRIGASNFSNTYQKAKTLLEQLWFRDRQMRSDKKVKSFHKVKSRQTCPLLLQSQNFNHLVFLKSSDLLWKHKPLFKNNEFVSHLVFLFTKTHASPQTLWAKYFHKCGWGDTGWNVMGRNGLGRNVPGQNVRGWT